MEYWFVDILVLSITLIVLVLIRVKDRKNRQIHLVKLLMENMKKDLDITFEHMNSSVKLMESDIETHQSSVRNLLQKVDNSLTELDKHANDLGQLQAYITHYHRILQDLSSLTEKAEHRLQSIDSQMELLGNTIHRLDLYEQQIYTIQEKLGKLDTDIEDQLQSAGNNFERLLDKRARKHIIMLEEIVKERLEVFQNTFDQESVKFSDYIEALQNETANAEEVLLLLQSKEAQLAALAEHPVAELPANKNEQGKEDAEFNSDSLNDKKNEFQKVSTQPLEAEVEKIEDTSEDFVEFDDSLEDDDADDDDDDDDDAQDFDEDLDDSHVFDDDDEEDEDDKTIDIIIDGTHEDSFEDHYYEEDSDDEIVLSHEDDEDDSDEEFYDSLTDDDLDEDSEEEHGLHASEDVRRVAVEEYAKEGFTIQEIAELTDIPKGEIALILDLLKSLDQDS